MADGGQDTIMCWFSPNVGVLPLPKATYSVPSRPTIGCEPWSWSHALGSLSPLPTVQSVALDPLISIGSDQLAPPSIDWLKKIGLSKPTPCPVFPLNRVHVTYT